MMSPPPPPSLDTLYRAPVVKEEEAEKAYEGWDKEGDDDADFDVGVAALVFGELPLVKAGTT